MKKKNEELRYESVDRVARWNLCQQLTSVIYKSFLTNKKIKELIHSIYDIEHKFCE